MSHLDYLNELKRYYTILGKEKNKKGEEFYVCAIKEKDYYKMIILKSIDRIQHKSYLNISTEYDSNDKNKMILKIADIIVAEKNIGNGSILMKYLFQYANKNENIKKVIGTMSEIDKDHFDRLEHFYKKHGFKVVFYIDDKGERIAGDIEKDL
ncbi:hypothetical protein I6U48_26615 [Clostridium sp. PL3]|uniref:Uncharacterized protein n=1 Tax=Clostridium thailandense TaxID=2794346 RepID=A0A949U153_9CLOT|nr:hypothetical protein [Clostridium thailandense]MBV7276458.1 hypothetical protein [Clostridium thailandense]